MSSGRTVRGRGRGGRPRNQSLPYTPPSSRSPTPPTTSSGASIYPNTIQSDQQAGAAGSADNDSTLPPSPSNEFQHSPSPASAGLSSSGSMPPPPPINLPIGKDPTDGKTWIYPQGASFTPVVNVVRDITAVIQAKFDRPCYNISSTPPEVKEMWFNEWAKRYKWLPQYEEDIKRNWTRKVGERLQGMMTKVREDLANNKRPMWIPEAVLDEMVATWSSGHFKEKQDQAKQNRASARGGSLHTCGSILVSEHRRSMREALGREPTLHDLFFNTHKRKDNGEFVDQRSADAHAKYIRIRTALAPLDQELPPEQETAIWLEVVGGKNKKGRIFGAGSETPAIGSSASQSSTGTTPQPWVHPDFQAELERRLTQETTHLREETTHLRRTIQTQQEAIQTQQEAIDELKRLFSHVVGKGTADDEGQDGGST